MSLKAFKFFSKFLNENFINTCFKSNMMLKQLVQINNTEILENHTIKSSACIRYVYILVFFLVYDVYYILAHYLISNN